MEKIGKAIEQVLKDVGQKVKNTKNSTLSSYKCSECGKELTWQEFKDDQEWELPVLACEKHFSRVLKKKGEQLIANIKSNIDTVLKKRNISPKYLNCSFDNFQVVDKHREKYFSATQEWVLQYNLMEKGLFFSGPNGTGKTHLAVAVMRGISLRGELNWYFIKSPYLFMEIRRAFKRDDYDSEENLVKKFIDYKYLVIDELGVETTTGWMGQTLYLIIDGRSDQLKPTIITTNLSLQDIENQIDPRLASRIVGMSEYLLEFTCDDWRLRKKG